jgi:hypothetical protein
VRATSGVFKLPLERQQFYRFFNRVLLLLGFRILAISSSSSATESFSSASNVNSFSTKSISRATSFSP